MIRKTAIITGAFGDIGKATARKFAQNGYNLALTYLNSFDTELLSELKGYDIDVLALHCDQTSESEIINFVSSAYKEFENIDVCICCAGKAESSKLLSDKQTDEIDDIISSNLRGTILFNREISKRFLSNKHGVIVNVSSIYGEFGGSMESVYSACKAGINGLTKSLAVELAPFVRVNAVAPGLIQTKMTIGLDRQTIEYCKNQTPMGRVGEPDDIANIIYFLASDESSFITGEVVTVSGGALRL